MSSTSKHLTPEERAAINRANAAKSTGPKTPQGKEASRLNGYRHGATGQAFLHPEKDMDAYKAFTAKITASYAPANPIEEQFAQTIADGFWRLNRLRAIEFNLLSLEFHEHQNDVNVAHDEAHVALTTAYAVRDITSELARLSMYEQRLTKMLHINIAKLEALQTARKETQENDLRLAAGIREFTAHNGQTWNPSDDGFAFTLSEIDAAARRFQLRSNGFYHSHRA